MRNAVFFLLCILIAGCGPVTVNTPAVASNRKMAFSLDEKGQFTYLPESKNRAIYLTDIYGNFLTQLTGFENVTGWCDFSPSNDMILYIEKVVSEDGEDVYQLNLYNLKTEKRSTKFKSSRFVWFPQWSPNGKYISFAPEGKGEIIVLDWRLEGWESVTQRIKTNSVFYRWLPDATGFLTVDRLDEIDSIEGDTLNYFVIRKKYLDTSKETEDLIRGYSRACWPDISTDSSRIVFNAVEFSGPSSFLVDEIKGKENVYLYDSKTKQVTPLTQGGISAFYTVISPDGGKVAFIDYNEEILSGGTVWVCQISDGNPSLRRVWKKKNAVYPFWAEADILGFVTLDPYEKIGKGFDDIRFYNLGNSNLISLQDRLKELFKTGSPDTGSK